MLPLLCLVLVCILLALCVYSFLKKNCKQTLNDRELWKGDRYINIFNKYIYNKIIHEDHFWQYTAIKTNHRELSTQWGQHYGLVFSLWFERHTWSPQEQPRQKHTLRYHWNGTGSNGLCSFNVNGISLFWMSSTTSKYCTTLLPNQK